MAVIIKNRGTRLTTYNNYTSGKFVVRAEYKYNHNAPSVMVMLDKSLPNCVNALIVRVPQYKAAIVDTKNTAVKRIKDDTISFSIEYSYDTLDEAQKKYNELNARRGEAKK